MLALSQERICSLPHRSGIIYMKNAHSTEPNENSCIRVFVSELGLITFAIYDDTPGVSANKKNVVQKWSNLQKICASIWQWFFSSWIFFVRLLVFEIWSILYMVDFDVLTSFWSVTHHVCKTDHISKTKSRTNKKLWY